MKKRKNNSLKRASAARNKMATPDKNDVNRSFISKKTSDSTTA